jgi:hypothetical protein
VLGRLFEVIDELDSLDPSTLSDAELHEAVVGMQKAASLFTRVRAEYLSVWDARRTWADDGSKAAAARLARECAMAATTARRELCRARKLRSMPHTATAVQEGKLSMDHADLLARINQPNVESLFARDEALLVDQIKTLRYPDAVRMISYWQQHAASELNIEPWTHQRHRRRCHASRTLDGTVVVDAEFDPIDGTIFLEELHRLEQRLFDEDWKTARDQHGPDATSDDLARTSTQRRADALTEMARRSTAAPDAARPSRPLFTVLVGYDAFGNMCEMADGTVVAPGQLIPYLADADIERIVFDGPSRVIDVGVRQRFFTGALRRAIEVRDRHCRHPSGCDVPAQQCEIDHVIPYSRGGITTQGNGRCWCKVHNRQRSNRPDLPPP